MYLSTHCIPHGHTSCREVSKSTHHMDPTLQNFTSGWSSNSHSCHAIQTTKPIVGICVMWRIFREGPLPEEFRNYIFVSRCMCEDIANDSFCTQGANTCRAQTAMYDLPRYWLFRGLLLKVSPLQLCVCVWSRVAITFTRIPWFWHVQYDIFWCPPPSFFSMLFNDFQTLLRLFEYECWRKA